MLKKDGMILEKLIYAVGFQNLMQVSIASNLIISRMLRISLNIQKIFESIVKVYTKQAKYDEYRLNIKAHFMVDDEPRIDIIDCEFVFHKGTSCLFSYRCGMVRPFAHYIGSLGYSNTFVVGIRLFCKDYQP